MAKKHHDETFPTSDEKNNKVPDEDLKPAAASSLTETPGHASALVSLEKPSNIIHIPLKRKDETGITASLPKKRLGYLPTRLDNNRAVQNGPHLEVYGFHPIFGIEAYFYIRDNHNDGDVNAVKQFCALDDPNHKTIISDELSKANFTFVLVRRKPNTDNEIMDDDRNFHRNIIVRHVPDGESTKETRQHGLDVLETFLKSPQNTLNKIINIPTIDCTNESDPHSLDTFFLDNDIETIVRYVIDESELNKDFYSKYNELALKICSGKHYSTFARQLGFPE